VTGVQTCALPISWEGWIEIQDGRLTRLLVLARGSESLQWGNHLRPLKGEVDVAHLPAGHPIDLTCGVRYGLLGKPLPAAETVAVAPPRVEEVGSEGPEQAGLHLMHAFGPPFVVFRDKVQDELKLSDAQKRKLRDRLVETGQGAMQFFRTLEDKKPTEREKEVGRYRQRLHEEQAAFLKETLKAEQLQRLRQIELQQEGLFALGRPEVSAELELTDEQRKRFMTVVQQLEKELQPLMKEAQSRGSPEEIMPKIMHLRKDHESQVETILSGAQKKQWRKMLGKPLALDD